MRRRIARGVGRELVVVDRARTGHEEDLPAVICQPLAEVGLVGVDEEIVIQPADRLGRLAAHEHRARLHPAHLAHAASAALHRIAVLQEQRRRQRPARIGQPPRAGRRLARTREQLRAGGRGARVALERVEQRPCRPASSSAESSLSSRQKRPRASRSSSESLSALPLRRSSASRRASGKRSRTAWADPSSEALSSTSTSCATPCGWVALDRVQAGQQVLAAVGVDHAVGERDLAQRAAASFSTPSARSASCSRSNSRSASARALCPMRAASSGWSRSQAILFARSRASPART